MSTLQQAWSTLAEHLHLHERLERDGVVEVEAPTLKRVTGWEPRLLMKFDSRGQRPEVLRQASILPLRNGVYAIISGDAYGDLDMPIRRVYFPGHQGARSLITLPWSSVPSSESQALDMALASGMLRHFLQERELVLTIRGRLRCPAFTFNCQTADGQSLQLSVDGVQTEVDAGLEGDSIHLVEAKLGWRSDFHVRQLYYPLRMWSLRSPDKPVTAVFCCYSDRLFHFWRYAFEPLDDYHGMRLKKSASYSLEREEPPADLALALRDASRGALPLTPFPQADSLPRVIDVLEAASGGLAAPSSLVARYGFTARQADYYANAARFLGYLEAGTGLTRAGAAFVAASRAERHSLLITRLAQIPIFREALEILNSTRKLPRASQLLEMIAENTTLSGSTVNRRAKTAAAWLRYVQAIVAEHHRPEQQELEF